MKKILFVISGLGQGGAERQSITVARLLKSRGYNVSFLCWRDSRLLAHLLDEDGIHIEWKIADLARKLERRNRMPSSLKKAVVKAKVIRYIRRHHGDVTISFMNDANVNCLLARRFSFCKWKEIASLRNIPHFESVGYSQTARLLDGASAIVSNSEFAMKDWLRTYPEHENKFSVIYNVVTLGEIKSEYEPLRDGKVHVNVAAGYRKQKNLPYFLKAVNSLSRETLAKLEIDWYGDKDWESDIYPAAEKYVKENHLEDVVKLNGSSLDIADLMYQSDIVGLFSSFEGLPNTICEGMAIGKPIIMTRVSDYEMLVTEKNGLLCDANDIESIANTLEAATKLTCEQLLAMGQESKRMADQLFSKEKVIERWINLIES